MMVGPINVTSALPTTFTVLRLGRTRYRDALALQRRLHGERVSGACGDLLLLTEHEPVLTLGRRADESGLRASREGLAARSIDLVATERGGNITYHGPGQLVAYAIVDLRRYRDGVRGHVWRLEESGIQLLDLYGLHGARREGAPGVWIGDDKIASLGVYVARSVAMHGIAINIAPRLEDFDLIYPCGLVGVRMTSVLAVRGVAPEMEEAAGDCARIFEQVFAEARLP
jgi:lipoyl(octanoyl) transferase